MRDAVSWCAVFLGIAASACGSDVPAGAVNGGSSGASGATGAGGAPSASGAPSTSGAANISGAPSIGGAPAGGGGGATAGGAGGGTAGGGSANAGTGGVDSSVATDPGSEGDGKITVTDMTKQPELGNQGNPPGQEFTFKLTSKIYQFTESTIAAGSPKNQPRSVWVYVPKQYRDGTAAPFMVIQDGQQGSGPGGRYGSIKYALDNLTVSKDPARKIPAFIAIAVQDGGGDGPNNERGLEYDTVSDRYARFVQTEVLPAVLADANIKAAFPNLQLTDNPEGRATFGCSSGAAAAFTMAWFHPEWFRRVVTYSATLVAQQNGNLPEHAMYPDGAWDYHHDLNLIAKADKKPLRIFTNANQHDNGYNTPDSGKHNWLTANEATHTALEAKGYHNRYVYGVGVGHCDDNLLRATLADSLVWVWRGFATP